MPDFKNPFEGLSDPSKLEGDDLIFAIRIMIAREYESIQHFMQFSKAADHKLVKQVAKELADEKRVHAGQLLRLLMELAPEEETLYTEGSEEVDEIRKGR